MACSTRATPAMGEGRHDLQHATPAASIRRRWCAAAPRRTACLTMAQATALEKGFAGPKDSKGRQVYPGFMFDTGIAATQGIPGLLHGGTESGGPAVFVQRRWTSMRGPRPRPPARRRPHRDLELDEPQHVLEPRRQADVLPRRQRSVVLRARHDRLLRADERRRTAARSR